MKNKKLISTLSAVAIAASITPVSAFADVVPTVENTTSGIESTVDGEQTGSVVTIPDGSGDGTSTTEKGVADETALNQAVTNAAENTRTTIKLTANITLDATLAIPKEKVIVLDLDGHTLTVSSAIDVISNSGNLTVKNGTIAGKDDKSKSKGKAINNSSKATLTVDQDKGKSTKLIGFSGIYNYGTATINNGTIESYNRMGIWCDKDTELTIYDGLITSPTGSSGSGRAISSSGDVNIYGGKFYAGGTSGAGDNYMNTIGVFNDAELTIKPAEGKTVKVTSETDYAVSSRYGAKVNIYGGEFTCKGSRTDINNIDTEYEDAIKLYGGTYAHEPYSNFIADNHVVVEENGRYAVKEVQSATDLTVRSYSELKSAINSGILEPKSITIGSNISIPIGENLTLKKGFSINIPKGRKLTVNGILNLDGTLLNNGTLDVTSKGFLAHPIKVTNNGTITNYPTEKNGVVEVSTPMQLQWLSKMVDDGMQPTRIEMKNDITIPDGVKFTPIGNNENRIFKESVFDGKGYKINNLNIEVTSEYRGGLFGYIEDASIKNITINGTRTNSTSSYIGALVGMIKGSASIENVHIENYSIESQISFGVGGFAGQISSKDSSDRVEFIGCSSNANITGHSNVGGIWGTSTGSLSTIGIYNCSLVGSSINTIAANGGICGGYGDSATVDIKGLDKSNVITSGVTKADYVAHTSNSANTQPDADADGNLVAKDSTGNWIIAESISNIQAAIGSVKYINLSDAIAAAESGDTVKLLNDISIGNEE